MARWLLVARPYTFMETRLSSTFDDYQWWLVLGKRRRRLTAVAAPLTKCQLAVTRVLVFGVGTSSGVFAGKERFPHAD